MKRFLMIAALTSIACVSASAGNIPTVGIAPPPPPPEGVQGATAPVPGDIPTGGSSISISESLMSIIQLLGGLGV